MDGGKSGTECTINIPKASHVEIIAIGGGGSSTSSDFRMQVASGSNQASGSLRVDNNFQNDINAASSKGDDLPDKIRTALSEWASSNDKKVYARYTVTSPVGAGGSGMCKAVFANTSCSAINPKGSWYSARTDYPTDNYTTDCWWYQHGKGGSSAKGIKGTIAIPLKGSSVITVEETTSRAGVLVNNSGTISSISLSASEAGGDPQWKDDKGKGYYVAGKNGTTVAKCSGTASLCNKATTSVDANPGGDGGIEETHAQRCADRVVPAKSGIVSYKGKGLGNEWQNDQKAAFDWQYSTLAVIPKLAQKGNYGKEITQTFENLDGIIVLHPGKAGKASYAHKKSDTKNLINANGGKNGVIYDKNDYFDVNEQIPSNIAALGKADNANHFSYLNKVKGSGFNLSTSKLIQCESNGSCPGYAGTGTYLFVRKSKSNAKPKLNVLTIRNNQSSSGNYSPGTFTKDFSATGSEFNKYPTCPDGDIEVFLPQSWASYCIGHQQKGIGGAIIVIW